MQDEQVQFNSRGDQQSANLLEQAKGLADLKAHPPKPVVRLAPEPVNMVFSRPVLKPTPDFIKLKIEQEQRDAEARERMQGFSAPEESLPETPPSLYHEIHGETMLKNVLAFDSDNARTEQVNNYILQKMRVGKLEDTKANFEKVLNNLLAKNGLSRSQQKNYLVNKLSLYLYASDDMDETDDLVLSILNAKRGKRNGIRR